MSKKLIFNLDSKANKEDSKSRLRLKVDPPIDLSEGNHRMRVVSLNTRVGDWDRSPYTVVSNIADHQLFGVTVKKRDAPRSPYMTDFVNVSYEEDRKVLQRVIANVKPDVKKISDIDIKILDKDGQLVELDETDETNITLAIE